MHVQKYRLLLFYQNTVTARKTEKTNDQIFLF